MMEILQSAWGQLALAFAVLGTVYLFMKMILDFLKMRKDGKANKPNPSCFDALTKYKGPLSEQLEILKEMLREQRDHRKISEKILEHMKNNGRRE
jgi:hypothetical protein